MDPISQWVESYMHLVGTYLADGHCTSRHRLGGVVLSVLHGTGMASDQTEVTTVPSVLAGLVWRAHSYQSGHAWLGSTSPRPSQGSRRQRGCESLTYHAAKAEGRDRG